MVLAFFYNARELLCYRACLDQLIGVDCAQFFPMPHSVMSQWYFEIGHDGTICTPEMSRHNKLRLLPFSHYSLCPGNCFTSMPSEYTQTKISVLVKQISSERKIVDMPNRKMILKMFEGAKYYGKLKKSKVD